MKINLPVTGIEKPFTSGSIVTKTDLKGVITYANDAFCEIAGFSREELIGQSHNVVRHPDMPPEAFDDLWRTVRRGKPWRGLVKNRCKNGDHYWVEAFVVPVRKGGQVVGYMSVRTPPSREQIAAAEILYAHVKQGKSLPKPGWTNRITVKHGLAALIALMNACMVGGAALTYFELDGAGEAVIGTGALTSLVLGAWISRMIERGTSVTIKTFERVAEGHLNNRIDINGESEPGRVLTALAYMQVHLKVIIDEVAAASSAIETRTAQLEGIVEHVVSRAQAQTDRVMQASAAMEEMTVSIREVAESAKGAADAAVRAQEIVGQGNSQMHRSMEATSRVVRAVEASSGSIGELDQSIQRIGDVTKVIKDIADQTNLLALNAAIEAARAGDQGRGFSVVADEVRKLAERTTVSTTDIAQIVEGIHKAANVTVHAMHQAGEEVQTGMALIRATGDSFQAINQAAGQVTEMASHIASASIQQSTASEDIANGMEYISTLAEQSMRSIRDVRQATEELERVTAGLQTIVKHFDSADAV
ncbi:MAG: PAS domain-containing methyl-accepting chemotaxis protein [Betaproteobacteria bacterium]|nr:PAS domain-containing methyl-accepting chemotaxis protein [Betaproteobacteria bacterium]